VGERCGRGSLQGGGRQVDVAPEVVEMAACDAQHLGRLDEGTDAHEEGRAIDIDAHVSAPEGPMGNPGGASDIDVGAHAGVTPVAVRAKAATGSTPRATQTIPPAIRRRVLRRDRGCCVVPGCQHAVFVDIHDLDPRVEGGQHDPDKMVTLCGAHHLANHRGSLVMEGRVSTGLTFRHADGSPYGALKSADVADASAQTFQALRRLGFQESAVRRALAQAMRTDAGASVEALVRACLLLLTERRVRAR
jgi:hypothetical protein